MADSIRLEVKGLAEIKRKFELLAKNAPVMASKAINAAASDTRDHLLGSTFSVFNTPPGRGPTPFTVRSFDVSYSAPNRLYAQVGLKEYRTKTGGVRPHYLRPQVFGGGRPLKVSEERLGGYYVPGAAAKLNPYGNIAELQKILSALGLRRNQGVEQKTDLVRTAGTRRGSRPAQRDRRLYWYGRVGKKQTLGVWAVGEDRGKRGEKGFRTGRIRPVLILPDEGKRMPRYEKRWPFFELARKEFNRVTPKYVSKYFNRWVAGQT